MPSGCSSLTNRDTPAKMGEEKAWPGKKHAGKHCVQQCGSFGRVAEFEGEVSGFSPRTQSLPCALYFSTYVRTVGRLLRKPKAAGSALHWAICTQG